MTMLVPCICARATVTRQFTTPRCSQPTCRLTRMTCRSVAVMVAVAPWSAGCGSSKPTLVTAPVSGVISLDRMPLEHAVVTFIPIDGTPGGGAVATTDVDGRYVMRSPQRTSGLTGQRVLVSDGVPPGRYRVVVSRRLHADGSPMRPDEIPMESQAVETIARVFSDEAASTLTVDVPAPGGTFDWHVKGVRR